MLISYWLDVVLENNKVIQGCESSIHMVYRLVGDHLDTTGSKWLLKGDDCRYLLDV